MSLLRYPGPYLVFLSVPPSPFHLQEAVLERANNLLVTSRPVMIVCDGFDIAV
jgi:hypothetical protein